MKVALQASFLLTCLLVNLATSATPSPWPIEVNCHEVENRIVESRVRDHLIRCDQPREFGASDSAPSPPELLASAWAACLVSTLRFVAIRENLQVDSIEVRVTGSVDFSRALGLVPLNRPGISGWTAQVEFQSSMNEADRRDFLAEALACGAVLDNIRTGNDVHVILGE